MEEDSEGAVSGPRPPFADEERVKKWRDALKEFRIIERHAVMIYDVATGITWTEGPAEAEPYAKSWMTWASSGA